MPTMPVETVSHFLRLRRRGPRPDVTTMRGDFERVAALTRLADDVDFKAVEIGPLRGEWVTPPGVDAQRVIYYLHGGGYSIGSVRTHREFVGRLARAAGARALVIDYRLAPEHVYPAAVQDAVLGFRWLLDRQFDPAQVGVAGDSAGGGLALATLVRLRDEGFPLPASAVCFSPWTDLALTGASVQEKVEEDPLLDPDLLGYVARLYLGDSDPRHPLASPLYADLTGLPPLLIQVGTAEILLDDSLRLAERAKAAGVDVTLDVWPRMIHVWQFFASLLAEGQTATEQAGQFLRAHWK